MSRDAFPTPSNETKESYMRATRRTLAAENTQLRAQLAVHSNVTRKALNEYVRATRQENADLKQKLKAAMDKIAELTKPAETEAVAS